MPRARAGESVRDLVQQRLMDGIVVEALSQVARDGDALAPEVTQARASRGAVKRKAPRIVEVERNEGFGPVAHAVEFTHDVDRRRDL